MQPGSILAERFVVELEAGAGGMGTVYRARDLACGGVIALKVLREGASVDAQRMEREGALLASLGHPGIVRHVAHGSTAAGAPFLAMEWLEGETLAARLRERGPLPIPDAVRVARAAADALGAAHARGVVHRDVKPGNIFLVGGDPAHVKVLDFGIARRVAGELDRSLTTSGAVLGTPFYMAPEQARGQRDLDARADAWALGCVLYEMLSGRPPFDHESLVAVLAAILLEPPPPLAERCEGVPEALAELVTRALSKDATERPEDGLAFARALDALGPLAAASGAPSLRPRALTAREQRLTCVVLVERGIASSADAATLRAAHDAGSDEALEGRVRAAVEALGGRVEVLADGSLVVGVGEQGTPTDHAACAARCALALRSLLPAAAIAIAGGRATMHGRTPVGDVLDSGARLLSAPPAPGTPRAVRIDAVIAGLLDGRFELGEDVHGRLLRGAPSEPETARSLLGRASPFVGRDRELASLEALWDECVSEPIARAALVGAPAGAGKSRLVSELLRRIEARGEPPVVLSARGDPLAGGSPFSLLAQALRGASGIVSGEPIEVRRAKLLARVGRRLREPARAAAMLGEIVRVPFPIEQDEALRAARQDPQLRGDLARRALEDFLDAETAAGPVLVVLDDLHLGDRPSLVFLDAALRHLAARPLFVIGAGRPEHETLFPDLFRERDPAIVRLGRLTPRASRALITHALGSEIEESAIAQLVERADGNPFFLEELVRCVAGGETRDLPETVLGMVEARFAALDPESRRILRAVSVLGMDAPREGVLALLGAADRAAPIDERLDDLVAREILGRRPGDPRYTFRSALVREAAYATLTDDDRRLGHALAGAFLEEARHGEHDEVEPAVLAEHFERGGQPARAARWWARAAERALSGDDLGVALDRAERGLAAPEEPEIHAALLRTKAAVLRWRGAYDDALDVARAALALAPQGSPGWVDAASLVLVAAGRLGREDVLEPLRAAVQGQAVPDARSAQIVAICRAAAPLLARDRARADALLARAEALSLALAEPDPLPLAWLEVMRASRALHDGDTATFLAGTEAAVAFYERAGDARDACNQRVRLGNGWAALGDAERAEPVLRAALADAERLGLPLVAGYALQNLGHALALAGRWDEARAAARRAIERARSLRDAALEAGARLYLADVALATEDPAAAEREASAAAALLESHAGFRLVALATRSRALGAAGRHDEALELARAAAAGLDALGALEEGEARIRLALAEALANAGHEDEARDVARAAYQALTARAERISSPLLRHAFLTRVPEHAKLADLASGRTQP